MNDQIHILIVDDEASFLDSAELCLISAGFTEIHTINDSREVIPFLEKNPIDLVSLDLTMPHLSGERLLSEISEKFPEILALVVSGIMDSDAIIRCMQKGAKDYLIKPINDERYATTISNLAEDCYLRKENKKLSDRFFSNDIQNKDAFQHIVTQDTQMTSIFSYCETVSESPFPILIQGETGTGKELIAQALHNSKHPNETLVKCNVAGIDDNTFSDTLFGHVKGAYTGADTDRSGLIERAAGGTIFLDEIGDLSLESQIKLLRLLQDKEYYPLGSDECKTSHAWLIAATNKDLENDPNFRKDLYYRLCAHRISLPPIRERLADIPLLVAFFANKYKPDTPTEILGKIQTLIHRKVQQTELPGNVRELEGITANLLFSNAENLDSLETASPVPLPNQTSASTGESIIEFKFPNFPKMDQLKRTAVQRAVEHCNGNKTKAAQLLGVSKQTIFSILKG